MFSANLPEQGMYIGDFSLLGAIQFRALTLVGLAP